jgi:hypothetical protein
MNKRLLKRHKRKVARARERGRPSEPDLRTPEQIAAAREESRAVTNRRTDPRPYYSTPPSKRADPDATDAAEGEVGP